MAQLFTLVQSPTAVSGTGSAALTCAATGANNPVFAAIVTPSLTQTTPPNKNWHLAQSVLAGSAGHVEIWYLEGKYNGGGITSATFTGQSGVNVRGGIAEFSLPSGYVIILNAVGEQPSGSGTGATMSVSSVLGNAPDSLGLVLLADFFASATAGSWTAITGTTSLNAVTGTANNWNWRADVDQAQGNQTYTSGYSASGQTGWCAAYASFRAVRFYPMGMPGGEMVEVIALDPTSQVIVCGGDVEGLWRTADLGDHWEGCNRGAWGSAWNNISSIEWSTIESNTVYALVGDNQAGGGFMVSTDGAYSWTMRDTGVQGCGNHAPTPPFPAGVHRDSDRWVGHMIAQDNVNGGANGYIYCVDTKSGWIKRSTTLGGSWTPIPFASTGTYYARCVIVNPANPKEIWAGCWSTTSGNGGVFHCADATAASPVWNRLSGYTGTVDDLRVIGSYLYAACDQNGIYRAPVSGGAMANISSPMILTGSGTSGPFWTSIDGYVSGTNHIVIAVCGEGIKPAGSSNYRNIVKLTIASDGTVSNATDLTNQAGGVNVHYLPPADVANPNGRLWWKYGDHYANWLGGSFFRNPHILIDHKNTQNIYVCGSAGFWRSFDGGNSWATAENGMIMFAVHAIAFAATAPNHALVTTGDYVAIDMNGDPTAQDATGVTQSNPGPNGIESHAAAIDPSDGTVYVGVNQKYGSNAEGAIYTRPLNSPSAWTADIGFGTAGGGNACLGLFAGRDNTGNPKFISAICQGKGAFRGVWNGTAWNWTAPSGDGAKISATGNIGQDCPMVGQANSQYIYVFDRKSGIYRSADYGNTWQLIWAQTAGSNQSGRLALNPNNAQELWVSTTDTHGLYKLSGVKSGTVADGGVTATNITTAIPDPAGLFFFNNALYVGWIATATHTSAQFMVTTDGGATFQDAGGPEIGSYSNNPNKMYVNSNGLALLTSGENCYTTATLVPPTAPALALDPPTLPAGSTGVAYNGQENAHGGTTPYSWTRNSGTLPTGLTLNSDGSITGTPTTGGTFNFTAKVTDAAAANVISGTQSIVISAPTFAIDQASLPNGTFGTSYSQTLTASNGTTPYAWSISAGVLPTGLSIATSSNNGVISGIPTAYGSFTFTVSVADNASHVATQQYTIIIPSPALIIQTTTLAVVFAGRPYTAQMAVNGGLAPYTWGIVDDPVVGTDPLPPGLSVDVNSGTITGVSTTPGTFNVTFLVTDATGLTATQLIPVQVLLAVGSVPPMPAGHIATADDMNTLSAIVNFLLEKPLARIRDGTGGQAIGVSAAVINFTAADIDTDGMFSVSNTDRLTVQTPGWYKFRYGVVTNGSRVINCYMQSVSGPANPQGAGVSSPSQWAAYVVNNAAGCAAGASGLWPYYLYAGDYLRIYAIADSTGSSTDVSDSASFFSLEFVSV